jgi:hypothetical protein
MKAAMIIDIQGLDKFVIADISLQLQKPLSLLTKLDSKDIFFLGHDSFLYHQGVDQHAWHSIIHITLSLSLKPLQAQIIDLIEAHLKAHTIHMHFRFSFTNVEDLVSITQSDYPDFVTESNSVDVMPSDESEAEIYHGDIFADKADQLNAIDPSDPPLEKSKKKKA